MFSLFFVLFVYLVTDFHPQDFSSFCSLASFFTVHSIDHLSACPVALPAFQQPLKDKTTILLRCYSCIPVILWEFFDLSKSQSILDTTSVDELVLLLKSAAFGQRAIDSVGCPNPIKYQVLSLTRLCTP
jgi:hypothetical protein